MYTSRKMQDVVAEIAARRQIDLRQKGACLRLEMPHFDPLVIEVLHEYLVQVSHVYQPRPDVHIADPGIAFFTGYALWVPIEVTMRIGGYRVYAMLSPTLDDIVSVLPAQQADLAEFADMWAQNIRDQGWLEIAARQHDAQEG
jgi:hypothetical protein